MNTIDRHQKSIRYRLCCGIGMKAWTTISNVIAKVHGNNSRFNPFQRLWGTVGTNLRGVWKRSWLLARTYSLV